jgi:hypothetical protein
MVRFFSCFDLHKSGHQSIVYLHPATPIATTSTEPLMLSQQTSLVIHTDNLSGIVADY